MGKLDQPQNSQSTLQSSQHTTGKQALVDDTEQSLQIGGYQHPQGQFINLINLLHIVDNMEVGLSQKELKETDEKLGNTFVETEINLSDIKAANQVLLSIEPPSTHPLFDKINQALINKHRLRIRYQNSDGKRSKREISPLQLAYYQDHWSLDAWCHFRQELRQFKLSTIQSIETVDRPTKRFNKQELTAQLNIIHSKFSNTKAETAELVFRGKAARQAALQRWHPDQTGRWQDDEYHLSFPYTNNNQLIQDLLAFGSNLAIKNPTELKNKLIEEAKEIVATHEGS